MKTVKETKLKAVKEHLDDGLTIKEVCEKYKMNPAVLKFLTALYRRHGEEPFLRHREVKQEIIKYINYYNNERLVWKIKDSPTKYRESFYSNV